MAPAAGYSGAFNALVAEVRPTEARLAVQVEGFPGEFSQHDPALSRVPCCSQSALYNELS